MKTLIIDGNNLVHRTFWIVKTRISDQEQSTSDSIENLHIYFTLNAINSYVSMYKPTKILVAWDEKPDYESNIRKSMLTEYKGNRSSDSTPHQHNEAIKEMLGLLGIKSVFPRELEADDVIAYLCKETEGKKVIISVDRDFIQLVNEDVTLFDPIRKKEFSSTNFKEATEHNNVKEWMTAKCLAGDKSDNVAGIPKFGKVKINKYLNGEITLTEEEQSVFDRNRDIFCLSRYKNTPRELEYYNNQMAQSVKGSWKDFIKSCEVRSFQNILKKKESWYSLFFMQQKLSSLFA